MRLSGGGCATGGGGHGYSACCRSDRSGKLQIGNIDSGGGGGGAGGRDCTVRRKALSRASKW